MEEVPLLKQTLLYNSVETWLIAIVTALVVGFALYAVKWLLIRRFSAFAERTRTTLDDMVVAVVGQMKTWFMVAMSLYAGSIILSLPPRASTIVSTAAVILALVQGAVWSNALLDYLLTQGMVGKGGERSAAVGAFEFILRLAVWSAFLLLILDNIPGVDVGSLIAGFGVAGIAVALAVQTILSDLFSALSILLDKPFEEGDFVVVDEFSGTVEKIGLKSTRVRSLSGEQLVFSNSDLLSSRIRNYKRMKQRRVVFNLGVVYETPYEKLLKVPDLVREVIESQKDAVFDRAHFQSFGDSALNYEIVYHMTTPDYAAYMDTQQAINLELFRRFAEEGIEFAYPTQTIFLAKSG
jgi:small-conductance mechanosensitive channel